MLFVAVALEGQAYSEATVLLSPGPGLTTADTKGPTVSPRQNLGPWERASCQSSGRNDSGPIR